MNAVGACGLQLYRFGEAISIVFFTDTWRPDSFYDRCVCVCHGAVKGVVAWPGLTHSALTRGPDTYHTVLSH
jgi:hypothetical protein